MGILEQFRMDGKTALITGGSQGLGWEMAKALAEAGADVAVCSRSADRVRAAADELQATCGVRAVGLACNVADPTQVQDTVARVLETFEQIDVLINNAGINIRGKIEELSLEQFLQVQQTNVTGVWMFCRAVAGHMKARRRGRVINVGSTLSIVSIAERTPYAASKGAVLQLTRTLALEWAPYNITVNAILPGPFGTEMNRALLDDPVKYEQFVSQIPLGRWGEPHEIGGLVLFLASDASSFVTGAGIAIDGGWMAQ